MVIITFGSLLLTVPKLLSHLGFSAITPFISITTFVGFILLVAEAFFALIFLLIALPAIRDR